MSARIRSFGRKAQVALYLALAFAFAQQLLLILLADGPTLGARWHALLRWDAVWFRSIVEWGYVSDFPPTPESPALSNVSRFPVFPLLALPIHALGASAEVSLLVVSQIANVFFWFSFFLLAERWNIARGAALIAAGLLACYFGSYILAAPYSEGVFLCSLLALIYSVDRFADGQSGAWWLAALAGFFLGATRLVGVIGGAYPVLFGILLWQQRRISLWTWAKSYLSLGLAAGMGLISFLAYCRGKWGHWDLYFRALRDGWHLKPDLLFPLRLSIYLPIVPLYKILGFYGGAWSQIAVILFFWLSICALIIEIRTGFLPRPAGRGRRIPLYFIAWMMFYISLSSAGPDEFSGMYRYCLPSFVLLALALLDLLATYPHSLGGRWGGLCLMLAAALSLSAQAILARMFVQGEWME